MMPIPNRFMKNLCAALLLTCAAAGCAKDVSEATSAQQPYARRDAWEPRCLGYFEIDLPKDVEVAKLVEGYGFADEVKGLVGDQRIGSVEITEDIDTPFPEFQENTLKNGRLYYERILRGEYSASRRAKDYPKEVQELRISRPLSMAWRVAHKFTFATWIPEGNRVLWLSGRMSDDPAKDKGSAKLATRMIEDLWPRYQPRQPSDIPTEPGLCLPYGFVSPPKDRPEDTFTVYLPHRTPEHPALVFTLSIGAALDAGPDIKRVDDLREEWRETPQEAKQRREEDKRRGNWLSVGPGAMVDEYLKTEYLTVAGQRARLSGVQFSSSMDQHTYEIEIETLGDPGDPLKPRIVLMAQGLKSSYSSYKGLAGKPPPPPVDDAVSMLKQIALSMRVRPGAVATK